MFILSIWRCDRCSVLTLFKRTLRLESRLLQREDQLNPRRVRLNPGVRLGGARVMRKHAHRQLVTVDGCDAITGLPVLFSIPLSLEVAIIAKRKKNSAMKHTSKK